MIYRIYFMCFFTLYLCCEVMAGQQQTINDIQENKVENANKYNQIEYLEKKNDLSRIQSLIIDERKSLIKDTLKACYELTSHLDDNTTRMRIANEIALPVLKMNDYMTINDEIRFINLIANDTDVWVDDEWVKVRSIKAKLYLHAWSRINSLVDPIFDFIKNEPEINIMPPSKAGISAGGDPKDIKDPKIRAEYEKMIAENTKKIQYFTEQYTLKKVKDDFKLSLEHYLTNSYSRAPYNIEELRILLKDYNPNQIEQDKILNDVALKMGLK